MQKCRVLLALLRYATRSIACRAISASAEFLVFLPVWPGAGHECEYICMTGSLYMVVTASELRLYGSHVILPAVRSADWILAGCYSLFTAVTHMSWGSINPCWWSEAVMLYGWEGNRRSSVALANRVTCLSGSLSSWLKAYITKGDKHPALCCCFVPSVILCCILLLHIALS